MSNIVTTVPRPARKIHPVAKLFPPMSKEEYQALRDDINVNGLRRPITYWQGQLVDGRHRDKACRELGIEPDEDELDADTDPVAFIISENLHRRHLNESQRALVGANLKRYFVEQAKGRQKAHGGTAPGKRKNTSGKITGSDSGDARDQAGAAMGVSGKMIDMAGKVQEAAPPDLQAVVDSGEVSVSLAAKLLASDVPKEEQAALAASEKPAKVIRQRLKKSKKRKTTKSSGKASGSSTAEISGNATSNYSEFTLRAAKLVGITPENVVLVTDFADTLKAWHTRHPELTLPEVADLLEYHAKTLRSYVVTTKHNAQVERTNKATAQDECPRGGQHDPDEDGDCRKCLEPAIVKI